MELGEHCTNPIHVGSKGLSEADLIGMTMEHSTSTAPPVATLASHLPETKVEQNHINAVLDFKHAKGQVQGRYPKMKQGLWIGNLLPDCPQPPPTPRIAAAAAAEYSHKRLLEPGSSKHVHEYPLTFYCFRRTMETYSPTTKYKCTSRCTRLL